MNISTREDNDDTILNTNIYRVMLGDKGFEPMNTVIIIFFLNFELYFNHEHKINLFTKLIL